MLHARRDSDSQHGAFLRFVASRIRPWFDGAYPLIGAIAALLLFAVVYLDALPPIVACPCDHATPESLAARVCSLCKTAEERSGEPVYFLKDINPHKPNRYLALPKAHGSGFQSTSSLTPALRARLWESAVKRAEKLFPGRWGIAENSHFFRTQCHAHLHIGPLSPEVEDSGGTLYDSTADFPNPAPQGGMWLHPKDGKYCVHLDRDLAEIVLLR